MHAPRVADHRHHTVHALRVRVELVVAVLLAVHDGRLRRLDAVHLVVRAVHPRQTRRAHRLFAHLWMRRQHHAHLTLVHVTRGLVEVAERRQRRD